MGVGRRIQPEVRDRGRLRARVRRARGGRRDLGLCLFAVLSFLELLVTEDKSFSFLKVAGFLLMVSWLAQISTRRDKSGSFVAQHPQFTFILVLFLAWAMLSASWAEVPGQAAGHHFRYFQNMILFLIVYTAIRERKHAIWVAWAATAPERPSPRCFEPAHLRGRARRRRDLAGTIGDPNELAAVLVAGWRSRGRAGVSTCGGGPARRRRLGGGSSSGVIYTVSRGGLLALGFALIAAVLVGGRWRGRALVVTALGLLAVGYFAPFAGLDARTRHHGRGRHGRTDIWKVGWRMVEAQPITGIGSGNFPISSIHYLIQPGAIVARRVHHRTPKVAHNTYLQILAEIGIVGLALFLTMIGFSHQLRAESRQGSAAGGDADMELVARGLMVALVGSWPPTSSSPGSSRSSCGCCRRLQRKVRRVRAKTIGSPETRTAWSEGAKGQRGARRKRRRGHDGREARGSAMALRWARLS